MRPALVILAAAALCGCQPDQKNAATSASAAASAAPKPAPSADKARKFSVMPDMFVDESGIGIGPERIDLNKADGGAKLTEAADRVPIDGKQMTVRTTKSATFRDVAAVLAALGKRGAPTILVKMDGGRKDLPGEIVLTPETRIDTPADCSVVVSILEDFSTAVWGFKGGLGKKASKGLSGPDLTATGDNTADSLKRCDSKTAFFSSGKKLKWEQAFHAGALIRKADADGKIDKLVFLAEEPVAGQPVKLGK